MRASHATRGRIVNRGEGEWIRIHSLVTSIDLLAFKMRIEIEVELEDLAISWFTFGREDLRRCEEFKFTTKFKLEDCPAHSDESIARWVFACVERVILHELAECFIVGGCRVFDPHDPAKIDYRNSYTPRFRHG